MTGSVETPIVVDLMNAQVVATMKTGELLDGASSSPNPTLEWTKGPLTDEGSRHGAL